MYRAFVALTFASLVGAAVSAAAGEKPALKEALALQEAMQQAIRDAEPAIACIVVSRSEGYAKYFGETPPADNPGKLGAFNPADAALHIPPGELPRVGPGQDAELLWLQQRLNRELRFFDPEREKLMLRREFKKKFDLGEPGNVPESYGSGVVIDKSGLILTHYHVVRDAVKLFVRLPGDKESYADILAADHRSDLAVLKLIDDRIGPLQTIRFGDGGSVRKGQWVLSIANPYAAGFRDGSPSASWGIVSNIRRRAPGKLREEERMKTLHQYGTLLQTDARLNLGCSGGALINLKGELIGLTTSVAALSGSEMAGGFAVPLDDRMKRIIDVLRRGNEVEYGFLGVGLQETDRREEGVQINSYPNSVVRGSPAYRAGLRPNDRILKVNGMRIRDNEDLFLAVGGMLAGSEVRLEVRSSSGTVSERGPVALAKFYVPGKSIVSNRPEAFRGLRVDYTSVPYMRGGLSDQPIQDGVAVREVQPGTSAQRAGLRVDDVITRVANRSVSTPEEFYQAVKDLKTGPVELTLSNPEGLARRVRID
jgi:S1-C subfamily serine protease